MANVRVSVPLRLPLAASIAAVAAAALLGSAPARAALGGSYASIAADGTQLRAAIKVTPKAGYEVHALTLPSGTIVREYVSTGGVVFAVAWNGPAQPDLSTVLGGYFADFQGAAKTAHGGRNRLDLERPDLVMQSGGHMRAFFGRAYLVAAVPSGVSTDELR